MIFNKKEEKEEKRNVYDEVRQLFELRNIKISNDHQFKEGEYRYGFEFKDAKYDDLVIGKKYKDKVYSRRISVKHAIRPDWNMGIEDTNNFDKVLKNTLKAIDEIEKECLEASKIAKQKELEELGKYVISPDILDYDGEKIVYYLMQRELEEVYDEYEITEKHICTTSTEAKARKVIKVLEKGDINVKV